MTMMLIMTDISTIGRDDRGGKISLAALAGGSDFIFLQKIK